MQLARDGRRVLWLAHESAPKNFTAVDVSDPRAPKVIVQTDLPHAQMRSNSLEVAGDLMAVAYQVTKFGLKPAGFELFDISTPEKPRSIATFDASGPAFARLPPAVVRRRQDGAHGLRRPGAQAAQPEGRPGLPHRRRGESVEAGGGRALAPAGHHGRRRRAAAQAPAGEVRRRLSRAQHQRLSRAPRPLLPRLHRRRRDGARHQRPRAAEAGLALDQLAAVQRLQPHRAAAVRARAAGGERRMRAGQRRRLAEAGLDARRARRDQPRQRRPRCRRRRSMRSRPRAAASAPTTCTRTRRCRAPGARRTSCSAPSSMPACAPTT